MFSEYYMIVTRFFLFLNQSKINFLVGNLRNIVSLDRLFVHKMTHLSNKMASVLARSLTKNNVYHFNSPEIVLY